MARRAPKTRRGRQLEEVQVASVKIEKEKGIFEDLDLELYEVGVVEDLVEAWEQTAKVKGFIFGVATAFAATWLMR